MEKFALKGIQNNRVVRDALTLKFPLLISLGMFTLFQQDLFTSNAYARKCDLKRTCIITKDSVLSICTELDSGLFRIKWTNFSEEDIYIYKCFSISDYQINKDLLLTFRIVDSLDTVLRTYYPTQIHYKNTDCMIRLKSNSTESLGMNLNILLRNFQSPTQVNEFLQVKINTEYIFKGQKLKVNAETVLR
jgi:hypothetical protein